MAPQPAQQHGQGRRGRTLERRGGGVGRRRLRRRWRVDDDAGTATAQQAWQHRQGRHGATLERRSGEVGWRRLRGPEFDPTDGTSLGIGAKFGTEAGYVAGGPAYGDGVGVGLDTGFDAFTFAGTSKPSTAVRARQHLGTARQHLGPPGADTGDVLDGHNNANNADFVGCAGVGVGNAWVLPSGQATRGGANTHPPRSRRTGVGGPPSPLIVLRGRRPVPTARCFIHHWGVVPARARCARPPCASVRSLCTVAHTLAFSLLSLLALSGRPVLSVPVSARAATL